MWDRRFSSPALDVLDQRIPVAIANGDIAPPAPMSDAVQIVADLRAKLDSGQLESIQQIVEAACTVTGAEGAALAMRQNDSVVCTARAGDMAPDLGSELSPDSGISGQCLRSGGVLRCDDTSTDTRVDAEACRRLGLRSIALVPVGKTPAVTGILEAFSSRPYAFSDAHVQLLVELADLVGAAQGTQPKSPDLITDHQLPSETSRRKLILAPAAVVAAGLLFFVGWLSFRKKAPPPPHPSKVLAQPVSTPSPPSVVPLPSQEQPSGLEKPAPGVHTGQGKTSLARGVMMPSTSQKITSRAAAEPNTAADADAGRTSPSLPSPAPANAREEVATAPSVAVVSTESKPELAAILTPSNALPVQPTVKTSQLTGGTIDRRVNPIYPPEALTFRLEGAVVLKVVVKEDGNVRDVQVVNGNLLLARAATHAVALWHFRPFLLNGQPIEMTTVITLNFKLP